MKLYFDGSNGRRLIAEPSTYKEVIKEVNKFLDNHKFKSYYTRLWVENNNTELWMDVGSHTEFFIVTEFSEDTFDMLSNNNLLNKETC